MAEIALSGKDVLLKLGEGATAVTLTSARSNGSTINHNVIDTTTKRDGGWGSKLSGGGIASMTVNVEGINHNSESDRTFRQLGYSGASNTYTLVNGHGETFVGKFVITNFTMGGDVDGAETFSATLENDGEIAYTAAVA